MWARGPDGSARARGRQEIRIIEDRGHRGRSMLELHLRDASQIGRSRTLDKLYSPRSERHFRFATLVQTSPHRWIEAKTPLRGPAHPFGRDVGVDAKQNYERPAGVHAVAVDVAMGIAGSFVLTRAEPPCRRRSQSCATNTSERKKHSASALSPVPAEPAEAGRTARGSSHRRRCGQNRRRPR